METIQLVTSLKVLNEIRRGKNNVFTHEIRPETNSLFCELDEEGYVKEIKGILQPRKYNALKLSAEEDTCWFSIEKAEIELFEDRFGNLITYKVNGEEFLKAQIIYYLDGEIQA